MDPVYPATDDEYGRTAATHAPGRAGRGNGRQVGDRPPGAGERAGANAAGRLDRVVAADAGV